MRVRSLAAKLDAFHLLDLVVVVDATLDDLRSARSNVRLKLRKLIALQTVGKSPF